MTTHNKRLIKIGESLHASIPRSGEAMSGAYDSNDKSSYQYLKELIVSQAQAGADFIEVNVDKFGERGDDSAERMMREYVGMVAELGGDASVCIDSSDDKLLESGLEVWQQSGKPQKPLINSIKTYNADNLMLLSKEIPFSFIALLMTSDNTDPVADMLAQAEIIYDKATVAGFNSDDIYFDTCSFPLAIDMPMNPGEKSRTFAAFETIHQIKNDPHLEGVHFSLGVSNCARDLPGRKIGITKAYLAKAIEYGLDAAIIDVRRDWFNPPPAPGLVEMVDAFAKMDGSSEKMTKAMGLMTEFCNNCRTEKETK